MEQTYTPQQLNDYLTTTLTTAGLEDQANRFVIGPEGTLAYCLFGAGDKQQLSTATSTTGTDPRQKIIDECIAAGDSYITFANETADNENLEPVTIDPNNPHNISGEPVTSSNMYKAGIGARVATFETIDTLVALVKANEGELRMGYVATMTTAKQVTNSTNYS